MKCLDTIYVENPKRKPGEPERMGVPCGKCVVCMDNRRKDWTFRLQQEMKIAKTAHFVTLTYTDEFLPREGVDIFVLQRFLKRLRNERKKVMEKYYLVNETLKWPNLRYYAVGEYGERTLRPHYHLIMFNMPRELEEKLSGIWGFGLIHIGDVRTASIHYVTGYVLKKAICPPGMNKPFSTMSRRPGLGQNYYDHTREWHEDEEGRFYVVNNGYKQRLPKFYKDKLFTDEQKKNQRSENVQKNEEEFWKRNREIRAKGMEPGEYENLQKQELKISLTNRQKGKL